MIAARQVVAEPDQQVGGRLGVRAGPMRLGELDAEEVRQRRRACSSRGPDSPRGRSSGCRGSGRTRCGCRRPSAASMKPRSKPTEWPTIFASPTNVERLAGGLGGLRGLLDVRVLDAVHLVADDRPARVDEGRPAVGDLAALDLDRGDLDEIGHLRVGAGRLDVDDDELVAGVDARRRSRGPSRCRPRGTACSWSCRPPSGAPPGGR